MSKKAIYPGTFDPMTMGHIDIIRRAANIFDELVVAIAEDTVKSPLFSLEERIEIAEHEIKKIGQNIKVMPFKGLLVEFAKVQESNIIVRGLRAASDFEYEFQMSYMNHKIAKEIETIFIPATESGHFISSRFVKELARLKGKLDGFVSKEVEARLVERFK